MLAGAEALTDSNVTEALAVRANLIATILVAPTRDLGAWLLLLRELAMLWLVTRPAMLPQLPVPYAERKAMCLP